MPKNWQPPPNFEGSSRRVSRLGFHRPLEFLGDPSRAGMTVADVQVGRGLRNAATMVEGLIWDPWAREVTTKNLWYVDCLPWKALKQPEKVDGLP